MINPTLKKNMESFKFSNHPEIAVKIRNANKPGWMEIRNNNLLIKKRNTIIPAYPLQDPKKESIAISKQDIYPKDSCTVLIGMGLGHLANAILKNAEFGHRIIVVEPILFLLQEALSRYDFTEYIKSGRLMFGTTKEETAYAIAEMDSIFVIQQWLSVAEKYIMACEEYAEIIPYTLEVLNQERCNTGTVMGAGSIIAENDIKNIPYCIRHRGIAELKDLFKGKPAVLIATGAALDNNIFMLKDLQDKAVIISMAQGLRVLLAHDITPDFITTVDYGEVNYEHFKGLMDTDIPLVALNRTYAPILKEWQGPKFITVSHNPGYENSVAGVLYDKGQLDSGGSVSHLSFGLARWMGCDPIIMLGHGFSYAKNISHTRQVDAGGIIEIKDDMITWKVTDPRSSLKGKEYHQGHVAYLPGIFGNLIPVNIGLASFITSFERMFKDAKEKIINASEEGTKMKGVENMTFQKVINLYLKKKINKKVLIPFLSLSPDYESKILKTLELLKKEKKNLEDIMDNGKKGIEAAKKMEREGMTYEEYMEASKENEMYANKAHELSKANSLVGVAIYHASRKIYHRDYILDAVNKKTFRTIEERKKYAERYMFKNISDRKAGIEKSIMILQSAYDAAEKLIPMYQEVQDIFEKYIISRNESLFVSKPNHPIDLSDAEEYFKVGNWAHVLVDAEKAKKENIPMIINRDTLYTKAKQMRDNDIKQARELSKKERRQDILDYLDYVERGQKLGREEKKFKEAIKLFKKAEKLYPKKFDARWGLASAYFHERTIDKAVEYFKALHEDFPEFPRITFEYGLALLEKQTQYETANIQEGISLITEAMGKSPEFNHFYKSLGDLYFDIKDYKKAKLAYEEYRKYFPADYSIDKNLALCLKNQGDYRKALKLVK